MLHNATIRKTNTFKFEGGAINIIKDIGLFTLPNFHEINQLLSEGNNKLRGRERREELVSSCLDIKLYEENGCQYYFVGTIGEGMRVNIQRATVIRKIEGYKVVDLMFDKLLPLMNVSLIHNGQLTVVPFPFKYLREYVNNEKRNRLAEKLIIMLESENLIWLR